MNRTRVMLVDDMPEIMEYVSRILKADLYDIVGVAPSGSVALSMWAATAPDVIVLDISMPGLDGTEVARRIRASGCRVPIVFFSSDDNLMKDALEAGGSAFVLKAVAATDLPLAIREVLAGRTFVSDSLQFGQNRRL